MKQVISTATLQLQPEVAWAVQSARLLASLAGVPRPTGRSLAKAAESILAAMREISSPINAQFIIHRGRQGQQLRLHLSQRRDLDQSNSSTAAVAAAVERAKVWIPDLKFTAKPMGKSRALLSARLAVALPADRLVSQEVAMQWRAILSANSVDSAVNESQRRLDALAVSLHAANQRGDRLEQELTSLKKLNETLELLALVASKTDNGVIIADIEGRIQWINDSFQRLTDSELTNVIGEYLVPVIHGGAETSDAAQDLAAAIQHGTATHQELLYRRRSGETCWVSLSVTPVFDDRGRVTRWIGMARDVTQQRRDQEALSAAKLRAERASKAKSDFLANISHEIRTPMNAIIGMVDLLMETQLDQQQRELAAIAHDSSAKLLQLLNDVLDLSKIEAGRLEIHDTDFSLRETVTAAMAPFMASAHRRDIELHCNIDDDVPAVFVGDPIRLRQILMNLVGNAIKFTPAGSIAVEVRRVATDAGNCLLRFSVQDTGIGIATESLERIFQPFTQAAPSTAYEFGGTGLGLAICVELVRLMKGRMWATSEVGHGSQFLFECAFEVSRSPWPADSGAANLEDTAVGCSDDVSAMRILVADDHSANRLLLRRILEKCRHLVDEATDGAEAVRMAQAHQYDLLLLDIRMPHMDGVEAARQVRALADGHARPPVIVAVTANAMPGDHEKYLGLGMDDYLPKPLSARSVLSLVSRWSSATTRRLRAASNSDRIDPRHDASQARAGVRAEGATPPRFQAALQRLDGDRELLVEQMTFFLEDGPGLLRDVRRAIKENDHHRLELSAHRLKSLARSFDDIRLERAAGHIESLAHAGHGAHAGPLAVTLGGAYDMLSASIRHFIHGTKEIQSCPRPEADQA